MILNECLRRIWYIVNRRRVERELAEEMAAHREMLEAPDRFGNSLRLREESRDAWMWRWLDEALQDLRHAARTLVRAPGFAVTTVLILTLGIGLNLTFFQLLNVAALRPPNVKSPETLVRFSRHGKNFHSSNVPYPAAQFIREHNTVLSAVLTSHIGNVAWGDDASDRLAVLFVSANWFSELGHAPALGRLFVERIDDRPDISPVVVVSHEFWRTRLGGDPGVIGRTVRVNDRPATIIGVASRAVADLDLRDPTLWLLQDQIEHFIPGSDFKDAWRSNSTQLYARLRPGVSPMAAREALRSTIAALAATRPADFARDETLEPAVGSDGFRSARDRKELLTIVLLVGSLTLVVLGVTCANIGNLVLLHGIARLREFGVRAALGASRWRILRQQVVESLVIASLGAIGGLVVAYWSAATLAAYTSLPRYLDFAPDWRTIFTTGGLALFSTLLFGIAPAWIVSRRDLVGVMKAGGGQASRGVTRIRFRSMLVGSQVAGCCILLIVAGLMVRGLQRVVAADLGFEFERVAVMEASPGQYGIQGPAARAYWEEVKRTVAAHPDVEMLSLASQAPLGDSVNTSFYGAESRLAVTSMNVESSFFDLMGIPLLAGRLFGPGDDPRGVIIISRRLAMDMYGTLDVLGESFPKSSSKPAGARTIIGVAEDAALVNPGASTVAEQYSPIDRDGYGGVLLLARARSNPSRLLLPMSTAARAADGRVLATTSLAKTGYEATVRARRLSSLIASATGLLALTLACFGIFGIVAYNVVLRTKEIGIRRALGADGPSVVTPLVCQLAVPVGVGMVLGSGAGLAAGWVLAGAPFYLPATDVATPALVLVFFLLTAGAAAILPARRALGAEPIMALRRE